VVTLARVDLRSRRGTSEPLAFVLCFPIWWFSVGIVLVLGMWLWSMAINVIALNQAGQANAVGLGGEPLRRAALAAGLGGFARDYGAVTYGELGGRGALVEVNTTLPVRGFRVPPAYTVRQRVIVRREAFYARAPQEGWE
jgi:hypothetical protein